MDKDKFFKVLEVFIKDVGDKKLPKKLQVTITYSTGEKDVLNVSDFFWANMFVATKNRDKYCYVHNRLINLDHVVKMEYEKIQETT